MLPFNCLHLYSQNGNTKMRRRKKKTGGGRILFFIPSWRETGGSDRLHPGASCHWILCSVSHFYGIGKDWQCTWLRKQLSNPKSKISQPRSEQGPIDGNPSRVRVVRGSDKLIIQGSHMVSGTHWPALLIFQRSEVGAGQRLIRCDVR